MVIGRSFLGVLLGLVKKSVRNVVGMLVLCFNRLFIVCFLDFVFLINWCIYVLGNLFNLYLL